MIVSSGVCSLDAIAARFSLNIKLLVSDFLDCSNSRPPLQKRDCGSSIAQLTISLTNMTFLELKVRSSSTAPSVRPSTSVLGGLPYDTSAG